MKGRSFLELEEMFQKKVPAREFKTFRTEAEMVDVRQLKVVEVEGERRVDMEMEMQQKV
jgi:glycine cleavage system aminomethyltransferase T